MGLLGWYEVTAGEALDGMRRGRKKENGSLVPFGVTRDDGSEGLAGVEGPKSVQNCSGVNCVWRKSTNS